MGSGLIPNGTDDSSGLGVQLGTKLNDFDVAQMEPADDFFGSGNLPGRRRTLHQNEFSSRAKEWCGDRNKSTERTHRPSGDLICHSVWSIFSASPKHLNVFQAEFGDLLLKPNDSALHRLNQLELCVRPSNRKHDTGQSRTAPNINHAPASLHEPGGKSAIDDVSRPEALQLERANESPFFAEAREIGRELTSELDADWPKQLGGNCWFGLRRMFHVKLAATNDGVALFTFANRFGNQPVS